MGFGFLLVLIGFGLAFNKTAYYIVFESQLTASSFPQPHLAGKNVYVIQPANFTRSTVNRLRSIGNDPTVLLYLDFINVPVDIPGSCSIGHVMGDKANPPRLCETAQQPFYRCGPNLWQKALQSVFNRSIAGLYCNNSSVPTVMCQYPGLAIFGWSEKLADELAQVLAEFVQDLGADGLYLDGYANANTRASITSALFDKFAPNGSNCFIDFNGDGEADTIDQAVSQNDAWGRYFVVKLRQQLGRKAVIVANAAGENSDPFLNGLTVEMEYCVDQSNCKSAFGASAKIGSLAKLFDSSVMSVAWLKDGTDFPPDQQCAFAEKLSASMPYVAVGVDIFDGEIVICPGTK